MNGMSHLSSTGSTGSITSLLGRRVQISGSASATADPALIRYAHEVVGQVVTQIMNAGGGIVAGVGREPRAQDALSDSPSLVFDWTALAAIDECLRAGCGNWPTKFGLPVVLACSEKSESEIPPERRELYTRLLHSGRVQIESIMPGSRAAAFLRQRQARFGGALLAVGGGTGVEHLADLYLARRKPVIPLDLNVGSSRDDGTGGGPRLAKQSRSEPRRFIRFRPEFVHTEGTALAQIATRNGASPPPTVVQGLFELLAKLAKPEVFYVRLLNDAHVKFPVVESFFRDVVDPVVTDAGLSRIESGTDKSLHAFINVGIFDSLHFSSLAVVDVTGERPNCFIELGYALGNGNRVIVTAEKGTKLPFDQDAIPCHFWTATDPISESRAAFVQFWEKNIDRPSIVQSA